MADSMLSAHFSVAELTHTDTGHINRPVEPIHWINLAKMAFLLEGLRHCVNLDAKLMYSRTKDDNPMGNMPCFEDIPIHVVSCFRSPEVNSDPSVVGAKNSRHLDALAFDIYIPGMDSDMLIAYCQSYYGLIGRRDSQFCDYGLEMVECHANSSRTVHVGFAYHK